MSHSSEKFRSGTLLSCVSESFLWGKFFWISRGEYRDFPSKTFCLTVAKIFLGEPFIVSLFLDIEKLYASEVYVTIFRRFFFRLTVPKKFVGELFCASQKFLVPKKKLWIRVGGGRKGASQFFVETFLSHST